MLFIEFKGYILFSRILISTLLFFSIMESNRSFRDPVLDDVHLTQGGAQRLIALVPLEERKISPPNETRHRCGLTHGAPSDGGSSDGFTSTNSPVRSTQYQPGQYNPQPTPHSTISTWHFDLTMAHRTPWWWITTQSSRAK
jgi:hypothetical protein